MPGFAEARARRALEGAGLDITMRLERASSVTNEVWIADDYVIRVNRHPNQRLRREAALAPHLPAELGYPSIVAYGGEMGADYLIAERVPGLVLARCWPSMSTEDRRRATRDLARMLRTVHQAPVPGDLPAIDAPQLLGSHGAHPVDRLLDELDRFRGNPYIDEEVVDEAAAIVRQTAHVLGDFESEHLVHGDLTFENVLWDGERITAVLDFEWARGAPCDVDLDVFLRFCAFPDLHVADDYRDLTRAEDYAEVPWWVAEDYPELFEFDHQFERVRLYAIAFEVRELLMYPPTEQAPVLDERHAVYRLQKVVDGTSYLDQLRADR